MINKIELLSPAGDIDRLRIALLYGADAVYIGGQDYSLRANANNFSMEDIKESCTFAHDRGKKVYLTLNIVFHNEDLEGVFSYIDQVAEAGIDAFIVSDPFLITYIHKKYPKIEIHLSTQNSTSNSKAVTYFKKQGVTRVVLARELSKEEIQAIIEKTGVAIEVFIHGAMCTCLSGRCTLSNYATFRDSNRGGCSQVCRFAFDVVGEELPFTMATKDLNMAPAILEMIEMGITSLKVEGRMRSHYYLATVISAYRKLIDAAYQGTFTKELLEEQNRILSRVANRETSTHYFYQKASWEDQYYTGRQELSNQDYLGFVLKYDQKRQAILLSERNYFVVGSQVEIFMPSGKTISFSVEKIMDEKGTSLEVACHPEESLFIPVPVEVEECSMMRRQIRGGNE